MKSWSIRSQWVEFYAISLLWAKNKKQLWNWHLNQTKEHVGREAYKNSMTAALMNPTPKEYSHSNPRVPPKSYKRTHKFPPIKFGSWDLILSFNNELSHVIHCQFNGFRCKCAAKWKRCCCVETNLRKIPKISKISLKYQNHTKQIGRPHFYPESRFDNNDKTGKHDNNWKLAWYS